MASLGTPLDGRSVYTNVTEKIPVIGRLMRKREAMIVMMMHRMKTDIRALR
jgi:hypothetical protein